MKDLAFQNVGVSLINGEAEYTGFSYEKMCGRFAGTKKSGNKVTVRQVSTIFYLLRETIANGVQHVFVMGKN